MFKNKGDGKCMNKLIYNSFRGSIWIVFLITLYYYFPFSIEDSYIVGRYAHNFAEHGALAYNIEDPISALTSPLHAILEGILYTIFRIDPVVLWKYTSLIFLIASVFVLSKLMKSKSQKVFLLSAMLLTAPILLWTVAGLETILLLFLLSLLIYVFLNEVLEQKNTLIKLGFLFGFIFLTRFDTAVFLFPLALYILWINRRNISYIILFIFIPVVLILLWFGFSYFYYGHLMPTSYFSKHPSFSIKHVSTVARGLFWIGIIPLWVYIIFTKEKILKDKRYYVIVFAILAFIGYTFTMAASHMMMSLRPLVPYLPILFILILLMKEDISRIIIIIFMLFQMVQIGAMYKYGINFFLSELIEHRYIPGKVRRDYPLEQAYINIPKYVEFMSILNKQGKVVEDDWSKRSMKGKPIIFSLIEGSASYGAINSYFEGPLVTLGECKMPDYIMTMHAVGSWNLTGSKYKDNPFYTTRLDYETPKYFGPNTLRNFTIARFTDLSDNDKKVIQHRIDQCNSMKKW